MLTDNLQYLTDEERGWREETVNRSSTRFLVGLFRPRVEWRLVAALDRLAEARARLEHRNGKAQLEDQQVIAELKQQLAYYKARVENEQHAAENLENCHLHVGENAARCQECGLDITDNIHHPVLVEFRNCKQQLADAEVRCAAMSGELEVMRQRTAEVEAPQAEDAGPDDAHIRVERLASEAFADWKQQKERRERERQMARSRRLGFPPNNLEPHL